MALEGRDVSILGAGIGGLTAALALARRGAEVQVFEQAPELGEVGAGIQISPNGSAVLAALGIQGSQDSGAMVSTGTRLCGYRDGRPVLDIPAPKAGAIRYYHRADLLTLLAEAAAHAGVEVVLNARATGLECGEGAVRIAFATGTEREVPLLIAADGMRGAGRQTIAAPGPAKFTGQVAWRALVPWAAGADQVRAEVAMGPGRHVVTYPLRGAQCLNIVAVEERADWQGESWREMGDPGELRARFAGFGGRAGAALARVDTAHRWALHLHPVADLWHRGRAVLLGDAAHPTLPFMAQGACLAMEDAWVLAACLSNAARVEEGFAAYQHARLARTRRVVAAAAANARHFHMRTPLRQIAHLALRLGGSRLAPDYDWIYGHDVTRE